MFVLFPESMSQLCLGAVSGGVKFCMLSNDKCSMQAHSRKVQVEPDTVYIRCGKNSAYAHPRLPIDSIGGSLNLMLGELRPREDWLKIFQSYLDDSIHSGKAEMLLTPKKRKHRYFGQDDDTLGVDDNVLEALSSWELETTGADSLRLLLSSQ